MFNTSCFFQAGKSAQPNISGSDTLYIYIHIYIYIYFLYTSYIYIYFFHKSFNILLVDKDRSPKTIRLYVCMETR